MPSYSGLPCFDDDGDFMNIIVCYINELPLKRGSSLVISIIARFVSVPCPSPGCTSMVPRRLLDEHLTQCEHRVKECPKGCGEWFAVLYLTFMGMWRDAFKCACYVIRSQWFKSLPPIVIDLVVVAVRIQPCFLALRQNHCLFWAKDL